MRAFAVILLILAPAGIAHAETFYTDIGGREVFMEVPDGYCALMGEDENESRLMDFIAAGMEGVATFEIAFADCGQLEAWKAGRRASIDSFGYIASRDGYDQAGFPRSQDQLNRGMKEKFSQMPDAEFGQMFAEAKPRAQALLDELEAGVQVGQVTSLGYLGHDAGGTYIGAMQRMSNERGLDATVAVISSMMIVQDRFLLLYFAELYSGDARQIKKMLKKTKQFSGLQHQVN